MRYESSSNDTRTSILTCIHTYVHLNQAGRQGHPSMPCMPHSPQLTSRCLSPSFFLLSYTLPLDHRGLPCRFHHLSSFLSHPLCALIKKAKWAKKSHHSTQDGSTEHTESHPCHGSFTHLTAVCARQSVIQETNEQRAKNKPRDVAITRTKRPPFGAWPSALIVHCIVARSTQQVGCRHEPNEMKESSRPSTPHSHIRTNSRHDTSGVRVG
mmetsp:Transcript_14227/g.33888  ORF Transcript_14227/g.33888 Transcript_14227/m.33888 type:complete len:211 (+) Transcript_14227:946-1578(+)